MASVLVLAVALLVGGFTRELDATIESDLRLRARDVAELVREERRLGEPLPVDSAPGRLVQVLDLRNRVVVASPELGRRSILTPAQLRSVRGGAELVFDRGEDAGVRFVASRAADRVVVVGASLQARGSARSTLTRLVLIGGPMLLAVAVALGYAVAVLALRPVERMRRDAQTIGAEDPAQRLPVPPARDELAALGTTLNEMLDRLDGALSRERRLVADASHELRMPLAIVQAELELALRPGRPADELREALTSIAEEADRLVRLSDDLLLLARADRRELHLERRALDVGAVLEDAAQRARRALGGEGVLTVAAPPGLRVDADPLRVDQALGNLVGNAVRHGAAHVRLWAQAPDDEGRVELHVSDDGPGFPEEFLERAFERFARAEQARSRGGTGLGLAIVAAIAHAHGGGVGARNTAEGGADVWFSLPQDEHGPPAG